MKASSWILGSCLVVNSWMQAADWPQFLGLERNGVSAGSETLVDHFTEDGPIVMWKFPCGSGFAGPVVSEGTVFLFHRLKSAATLDAIDAASGKKRWSFSYETNYKDSFGFDDGPRACPTVKDGKVFLYGAEGTFHAVDAKTGKLIWQRDLATDYESAQGFFGRAGAPLVVGNLVLSSPGGPGASVVAMDVSTGKTKWQAGKQEAGYASSVLWKTKAGNCAVFFLRDGILGLSPEDGNVWFETPFRSEMEASVNAATPTIVSEDSFFTTACYGTGAALWKLSGKSLESSWKAEEKLDCHYSTPVFDDGFIYGMHGRQESGQQLRCIEASTGKVRWSSNQLPASEVLIADGKLLVLTEKGELLLIEKSPEKFKVLDRAQVMAAGHRSPPAISNGVLFARDKQQLIAVKLAK